MRKIYVGDTGTLIGLNTLVDLSNSTTVSIIAEKPSGVTVTWTGFFNNTEVQYITNPTSLDEPGIWKLQSHVINPFGEWHGEVVYMTVYDLYT